MRYWYEIFFSGNDEAFFPRMVSVYLRLGFINTNFNGFKFVGHFDGSNNSLFFWKMINKLLNQGQKAPTNYGENVKDLFDDIIAKLDMEKTKMPADNLEALLHFTFLNNIQLFTPLLVKQNQLDGVTPESLSNILDFNHQFFINTGRISHAYANEVGVPVMVQYSQPQFISIVSKSDYRKSGDKTNINVELTIRMDSVTQSTTRALIPWTGTAMVAGVDNRQVLVLPFKFQISYDPNQTKLSIAVNPTDKSTKEHLGFYNEPFTVRTPIVTPLRLSSLPDFKIMRGIDEVLKDDLIFPYTGFNLGAVFVGDVQPMFSRANANNFYANFFTNTDFDAFKPTNRYYRYKLGADYEKSKANSFEIFIKYIKGGEVAKDYIVFPDGAIGQTNAIKAGIIFKGDGDKEVSHFDTEFTWAKGFTPSRFHSQLHLNLHSGPYQDNPAVSRCIFVKTESPLIHLMATYKEVLEMEHTTQFKAETYYGVDDCAGPEPLMTLEGKLSLTDDKKMRLGYEEATDCQKTRKDPDNFKILSYNQAECKITWKEGQQARFPFSSYLVTYFIPGVLFPQAYTYYGPNDSPERTATLEAVKKPGGWDFKFQKPNMDAVGEQVMVPKFLEDFLVNPRPLDFGTYHRFVHGYDLPICYATKNKIQTFDELTFNHELGNCWTVAVRDCKLNSGIVSVRNNGGFEASVLWLGGFKVDITKDKVIVNGEVVEPGTVTPRHIVYEVDGGLLVLLEWGIVVKVTGEGIAIEVSPIYKGSLCGACSNYDGEHATATGPKGCSYSDYDLYMASWALPGDGCDDAALSEKKDKVAEYQATCNKQFVYPTGTVLTSMKESCYEYNYDVRTEGDYVCTSTEPISTCKPGCTSAIPYAQDVLYDCVAGDGVSSKKQTIVDLTSYAQPGCHYFKRIWSRQSQGCHA